MPLSLLDAGPTTIAKEQLSISPYWRRNFDDERWRQVKAAWLAEVEAEV